MKELARTYLLQANQAVQVYSDNQACIAIRQDPIGQRRTKHIDVPYHYTRELIAYRTMAVSYVPTREMVADMLTKPLPAMAFEHCIGTLL